MDGLSWALLRRIAIIYSTYRKKQTKRDEKKKFIEPAIFLNCCPHDGHPVDGGPDAE